MRTSNQANEAPGRRNVIPVTECWWWWGWLDYGILWVELENEVAKGKILWLVNISPAPACLAGDKGIKRMPVEWMKERRNKGRKVGTKWMSVEWINEERNKGRKEQMKAIGRSNKEVLLCLHEGPSNSSLYRELLKAGLFISGSQYLEQSLQSHEFRAWVDDMGHPG
jgi:hypothetical protein